MEIESEEHKFYCLKSDEALIEAGGCGRFQFVAAILLIISSFTGTLIGANLPFYELLP